MVVTIDFGVEPLVSHGGAFVGLRLEILSVKKWNGIGESNVIKRNL